MSAVEGRRHVVEIRGRLDNMLFERVEVNAGRSVVEVWVTIEDLWVRLDAIAGGTAESEDEVEVLGESSSRSSSERYGRIGAGISVRAPALFLI